MRVSVIPKRGLRLWEPVLWGLGLAVPVHQYGLYEIQQHDPSVMVLVAPIVALAIFPITDGLSHRVHGRMVRRSAVFGVAFGLIWGGLELLDRPMMVRAFEGNPGVLFLFLLVFPFVSALGSLFFTAVSGLVLDRLFGRQTHASTDFCCGCGYPFDGLGDGRLCPECGRDRSIPPESVRKNPKAMRFSGLALLSILIVWQFAHTTRFWMREGVPVLRFIGAIDSDLPASLYTYIPRATGSIQSFPVHRKYSKSIDVTRYARELDLDITHLTLSYIVWQDARDPTMNVTVGKTVGRAVMNRGLRTGGHGLTLIRRLDAKETENYLDSGGLTEARIREFMRIFKERWNRDSPTTIESPG